MLKLKLDFGSIFVVFSPNLAPQIYQIFEKSRPRSLPFWIGFQNLLLMYFGVQLKPQNLEKIKPPLRKSTIFGNSPFYVDIDFWPDFDASLVPFWKPKINHNYKESISKRHLNFVRFSDRLFMAFGCHGAVNLAPTWLQERQDEAGRSPRGVQNRRKIVARSLLVTEADLGSILDGFLFNLNDWFWIRFLMDFWWIYNWNLKRSFDVF